MEGAKMNKAMYVNLGFLSMLRPCEAGLNLL